MPSQSSRPPHENRALTKTLNIALALAAVVTAYLVFLAFTSVD